MSNPDHIDGNTKRPGNSGEKSFVEKITRAAALLKGSGRLSIRALRIEFSLSGEELEAMIAELVEVQQIATVRNGVLSWQGPAERDDAGIRPDGITPTITVPGATESLAVAERRQMTVLFCDVVGSTELSHRLDGETYRDAMRAYHHAAGEVVARFDGHVAQYLGDGLLVYFGFRMAHEDDPERAVRAGLAIIEALGNLNLDVNISAVTDLRARVGIHTGPVIISEMGDGKRPEIRAVGETVNLAARLQGEAEPDTVVISAPTLRLVQGLFRTRELGSRDLRGIGEIVVHTVLRPTGVRNRLDVAPNRIAKLVGRELELSALLESWNSTKRVGTQSVLIAGEAGVGKSRLLRALREHLADEAHGWFECNCSRERQGSAYYPLLSLLAHGFGLEDAESPAQTIRRLETGAENAGLAATEAVPLLAALLAVQLPADYPSIRFSDEVRYRKTIEVLCRLTFAQAAEQPVVLLVEDLHWCDRTTLGFLDALTTAESRSPLLILLSFRPEFVPLWTPRPHSTFLRLGHLERAAARRLAVATAGDVALSDDVLEQILSRADGVPLFVEELTKSVVESGLADGSGTRAVSDDAIPATLQGSLMARLDRLGSAKRIAQLGSVLGRAFSFYLVRAISVESDDELANGLLALVEVELLNTRGTPPQAIYSFRHALIEETAYHSMLPSDRRRLHAETATAMVEQFPKRADDEPDIVARHFDRGGLGESAVVYYGRAATVARQQFANAQALSHLRRAIEIVVEQPPSESRDRTECTLQVACSAPLFISRGWSDAEYGQRLGRARELALGYGEHDKLFGILIGLFTHNQVCGHLDDAEAHAREAFELAGQRDRMAEILLASAALSQAHYLKGRFVTALDQFESTLAHYEGLRPGHSLNLGTARGALGRPPRDSGRARAVPADGGAASAMWGIRALCRWVLGYPDQALEFCELARHTARAQGAPFNLASACIYAGWIHQKRGEYREAFAAAQEAYELSEELGFTWLAWAGVLRGSVRAGARPDDPAASDLAMKDIIGGIESLRASGTVGWVQHCHTALAELYVQLGRHASAAQAVDLALGSAGATGQQYETAELLRLRGELIVVSGDHDAAAQVFSQALDVARGQKAKSLELRVATSLARLWHADGSTARARQLLAPVLDWFEEGRETADLRSASSLYESLGP